MVHTIKTKNNLQEMLTEVISYLGWAFHPDDPMTDYVRRDTGEPSYTPEEAKRLDELMDEAFDFCEKEGSTSTSCQWKSAKSFMATSL